MSVFISVRSVFWLFGNISVKMNQKMNNSFLVAKRRSPFSFALRKANVTNSNIGNTVKVS